MPAFAEDGQLGTGEAGDLVERRLNQWPERMSYYSRY